ncbi:hypothetical protein EON77_13550 [bacterium]|nr:MAG: hypothetical protein EON77_13550 [bacterium]
MFRVFRRPRLPALALAAILAAASAVSAAGDAGASVAPAALWAVRHGASPVDQIIEQVERRHRAHVVRVGQEEIDGRRIYVLRLLSDQGRVWTVRVDAETGREI